MFGGKFTYGSGLALAYVSGLGLEVDFEAGFGLMLWDLVLDSAPRC